MEQRDQLRRELEMARKTQQQLIQENAKLQRDYYMYINSSNFYENKDLENKSPKDLEEAYAKALEEVETQRTLRAEVTEDYDTRILDLQKRLHQKETILREIKDSLTLYKREVALDSEFSRSGKHIPETDVDMWLKREAERDLEIREWRLRNVRLQNQLSKQDAGRRSSDTARQQANMINYEQLKIENQTYNEKIEERTEELQKLRKKINITVQILSHFKEKLQFVSRENQELKRRSAELEAGITEQRDLLGKLKRERDRLKAENARLRQEAGLVGIEELLRDYQMRKKTVRAAYAALIALLERHEALTGAHSPLLDKMREEKAVEDERAKEEEEEDDLTTAGGDEDPLSPAAGSAAVGQPPPGGSGAN